MSNYFKEGNVPTIGGSWIVNQDLVDSEDRDGITDWAEAVINTLK